MIALNFLASDAEASDLVSKCNGVEVDALTMASIGGATTLEYGVASLPLFPKVKMHEILQYRVGFISWMI